MKRLAPAFAAFAAFALAATSALTAQADTLAPSIGRAINLGAVNGVIYYTVKKDGFHVVATFASSGSTPFRFEAVLAPGQSVTLSSPNGYGEAPATVQISRRSNEVEVQRLPLTH